MFPIVALMTQVFQISEIKTHRRIMNIGRCQIDSVMYNESRFFMAPLTQSAVCHCPLANKLFPASAPLGTVIKFFCKISHANVFPQSCRFLRLRDLHFSKVLLIFQRFLPIASIALGRTTPKKAAFYAGLKAKKRMTFPARKKAVFSPGNVNEIKRFSVHFSRFFP